MPADSEFSMFNEKGEPLIWFFSEGSIILHREKDDVLMELVSAPTLIGLANVFHKSHIEYRITTQTDCQGFSLPVTQAFEAIEKNKLWQQACHWTTYLLRSLEQRDANFVGATTYSQIRATLLLMNSWSSDLRARTGVINFIQKRTKISRSVIAEILSALRKGNYIEMEKGKLKSVGRLPTSY
ncbi:helix-turn-helix domain-containing protein [Buttiauxella agrestis]|nr:helix-turn-helix domain-containing protein [Buttiauxella agrestis]